jgi:hypothetical protein
MILILFPEMKSLLWFWRCAANLSIPYIISLWFYGNCFYGIQSENSRSRAIECVGSHTCHRGHVRNGNQEKEKRKRNNQKTWLEKMWQTNLQVSCHCSPWTVVSICLSVYCLYEGTHWSRHTAKFDIYTEICLLFLLYFSYEKNDLINISSTHETQAKFVDDYTEKENFIHGRGYGGVAQQNLILTLKFVYYFFQLR